MTGENVVSITVFTGMYVSLPSWLRSLSLVKGIIVLSRRGRLENSSPTKGKERVDELWKTRTFTLCNVRKSNNNEGPTRGKRESYCSEI